MKDFQGKTSHLSFSLRTREALLGIIGDFLVAGKVRDLLINKTFVYPS